MVKINIEHVNSKITDNEMWEYVNLKDDGYFRLRLLQVLQQLAIAHGCYSDTENKEG